jgi:hypothetical protein
MRYKVIHHGRPYTARVDGRTYIEIPGPLLILRAAPGQRYAVSFTAGAALYRMAAHEAQRSHGVAVAFMGGDLI